jgi:hypothetical protein
MRAEVTMLRIKSQLRFVTSGPFHHGSFGGRQAAASGNHFSILSEGQAKVPVGDKVTLTDIALSANVVMGPAIIFASSRLASNFCPVPNLNPFICVLRAKPSQIKVDTAWLNADHFAAIFLERHSASQHGGAAVVLSLVTV